MRLSRFLTYPSSHSRFNSPIGLVLVPLSTARPCMQLGLRYYQRYKRKGIGNEIFTKFLREARVIGRG